MIVRLLHLSLLLAVLFCGCRTARPAAEPNPEPDSHPEPVALHLVPGLEELIWRWDTPNGAMPEKPRNRTEETSELQRRFDKFCADTGIVAPGEPFLLVQRQEEIGHAVVALPKSRAWLRLCELTHLLGEYYRPNQASVNLLAIEVPTALARAWGLDGLPAVGDPPPILAKGMPLLLEPEVFSILRSAILAQPGTRVFAAANAVTLPGKTVVVRQTRKPLVIPTVRADNDDDWDEEPFAAGLTFQVGPCSFYRDRFLSLAEVEVNIVGEPIPVPAGLRAGKGSFVQPSIAIMAEACCAMGQTVFIGSVSHSGQTETQPLLLGDGSSCLLFFITMNWASGVVQSPSPDNFSSPSGQLYTIRSSGLVSISGRERRRDGIDWGDTEDEEEGEKGDENYEIASAIKEVFGQFGLVFLPSEKMLFYRDTLVYFGRKENIRRIDRILSESCPGPIPVRRRSTALRLSPRLWLKWLAEKDENSGDSVRSLGKQEVMTLLREVEQDQQSAILSSTTVTSRSGYTSRIQSVGSLFMPPESWQVGTVLEADSLVAHNSFCATMELVAKHADFVPPKKRSAMPAFPLRSNEIETNAVMQFGRFYLLGGGGGIAGEPLVVWLVGLDSLLNF